MRKVIWRTVTGTLLACLLATPLMAAETTELDEMRVTAAKADLAVDEIPGAVSVIDAGQLEARHLPNGDVGDALRSLPGVTLRRAYAPFPAYPNIRGMGSSAVVILVNGIPSNWEITQAIPPENIARVEVLRGPASALYGANATGGVINIVLKEGGEEHGGSIKASTGSFATHRVAGSADGSDAGFSYALAATHECSDGARVVTNLINPGITMIQDTEYDKTSASLNTAYGYEGGNIGFFYNYFNDDYTRGRPHVGGDWDRHLAGLTWDQEVGDRLRVSTSAGYRYDDLLHLYDNGKAGYDPRQERTTDYRETPVDLRLDADCGAGNTLTVGTFANRQTTEQVYRASDTGAVTRENEYLVKTFAGYIQDVWQPVENLTVTAGLRYDYWKNADNYFSKLVIQRPRDRSDDSWSPKLGVRYGFGSGTSIWAGYAEGFLPPTPKQLYDDHTSGGNPMIPNPDLKPEQTRSGELGLDQWVGDDLRLSVVGFYAQTEDKILAWFNTDNVYINRNIGETVSYGAELACVWYAAPGWTVDANYTINRALIEENPVYPAKEGNLLPFSPKYKANLAASYADDDWSVRVGTRYLSKQYTNDNNIEVNKNGESLLMDESLVWDVKVVRHWRPDTPAVRGVDLSLSIDNLFNEEYRSFYMYEDPGQTVSGEVRVVF